MTINPNAQAVLDFWFAKSDDFDNRIREQFFDIWQQAKRIAKL